MNSKDVNNNFIKNEKAISEEFTILPALTVAVIGFSLFILIVSNVYNTYNCRIETLDSYQSASFIASKLTNPDCYFMMEGGIINLPLLDSPNPEESDYKLNQMRNEIAAPGVNFSIVVSWDSQKKYFPEDNLPSYVYERVAVSKTASIFLNEAQTKPGKLTVIMWEKI